MKKVCFAFSLLALAATPGRIDQVCRGYCSVLVIQDGTVRLVDRRPNAPRSLAVGAYVPADQHLVPRTEAPIRDIRSPRGWRIVVSAFMHHDAENEGTVGLRLRFFDPGGVMRQADDVLFALEQAGVGSFSGGTDEIFAITSYEEHAYNSRTEVWFLPDHGKPKALLTVPGDFLAFATSAERRGPGVTIARQTYDGVHAETKGSVREFYAWNPVAKSLSLRVRR